MKNNDKRKVINFSPILIKQIEIIQKDCIARIVQVCCENFINILLF